MKESRGRRGEVRGMKETRHGAVYKSAVASCRRRVIPPTTSGRLPGEKLRVQHKPVTVSGQQVTPPSVGDSGNSAEVQVQRYWSAPSLTAGLPMKSSHRSFLTNFAQVSKSSLKPQKPHIVIHACNSSTLDTDSGIKS